MRMIIVEGHDGAGKTTFCNLLEENYAQRGFCVERVKFPTEYPPEEMFSRPSDLMMFYLRNFQDHMQKFRGRDDVDILIVDRAFLSTMVYQGFYDDCGRDTLDKHAFEALITLGSRIFCEGIETLEVEIVHMHCKLQTAMGRIRSRQAEEKDALERLKPAERAKKIATLKDRYVMTFGAFKYGWQRPHQPGGNEFDRAHIIEVDTTELTPSQAVSAYLNRSLEPEYFETVFSKPKGDGSL